jgi:hypothetical protein
MGAKGNMFSWVFFGCVLSVLFTVSKLLHNGVSCGGGRCGSDGVSGGGSGVGSGGDANPNRQAQRLLQRLMARKRNVVVDSIDLDLEHKLDTAIPSQLLDHAALTPEMLGECTRNDFFAEFAIPHRPAAPCSGFASQGAVCTPGIPVLLASFPRSGNTWLRHLLELGTAMRTGSVYLDPQLRDAGPQFAAEGEQEDVLLVKTHEPLFLASLPRSEKSRFIVLLVRHPLSVIASYYQYQASFRRRNSTSSHTAHFDFPKPPSLNSSEPPSLEWTEWAAFVRTSARLWRHFVEYWFRRSELELIPLAIVRFEDIAAAPEETLRCVLEKIQPNMTSRWASSSIRMLCAAEYLRVVCARHLSNSACRIGGTAHETVDRLSTAFGGACDGLLTAVQHEIDELAIASHPAAATISRYAVGAWVEAPTVELTAV